LTHHEDLLVPHDERSLRHVQRRVDGLDRRVRAWAQLVIDVLPRGISLIEEEIEILSLAHQRRLNLQLDAQSGDDTLRTRLGRVIPFLGAADEDAEVIRAIHRMVATRLESDIE